MPANAVLIVGDAGSGKSTSMTFLPPEETFIINVSAKPLPFKGWKKKYTELNKDNPKGNLMNTDNADMVVKTLKYVSSDRPEIKYVVIDDSQYVAANEYMRKIHEKGLVTGSCKTHLIDWNTLRAPHTPLPSNEVGTVKEAEIGQSAAKGPYGIKVQRLERKLVHSVSGKGGSFVNRIAS